MSGVKGRNMEEAHPCWKGVAAAPDRKRARARRRYPLGPCEKCGAPGTDRHHKDGNLDDYSRENILILCRKCHMVIDGRLAKMPHPGGKRITFSCSKCGSAKMPFRRTLCGKCYDREFRPNRKH